MFCSGLVKVPIKLATAATVLNDHVYSPMNLIDSNIDTFYASEDPQQPKKLLWVQLELSNVGVVSKIVVTNRRDGYGERFKDVTVRVGAQDVNNASSIEEQQREIFNNELCNRYEGPGKTAEFIKISCDKPVVGKFIIIQIMNIEEVSHMNIAEVEVYGDGEYSKKLKIKYFARILGSNSLTNTINKLNVKNG